MKRILLLYLAVVLTSLSATAQQYGNEWIDYTKTYYRFLSDHTGLIRIDYSTLSQLGIPLQGSNLKMYARGEEIPIYVSTDGTFGAQDYIEFYGEANDGYFDTQMFINPDYHFNPYRSFFSTKTAYYLTYSGGSNKRMAPTSNDVSNAGSPEPYFIHESIKQLTTLFNPGEGHRDATGVISHYAFFEKGEGRASTTIETSLQTAAQSTFDVDTKYKYTGAPMDASVRVRMCGAGQAIPAITNHFFKIKVNNQTYANESIFRWDVKNILFNMQTATLGTDKTSFYIQPRDSVYAVPNTNITFDLTTKVKLAYIRVDYPRLFNFDNQKSFLFNVEVPNEKYIEVVGFEGGSSPILYDLTAQRRLIPVVSNGVYKFKLQPGGATKHKLYIVNSTSNLVKQIPFNDFKTINFTNYQSASNQGNYLIISHPDLRTGAVDQVEQYRQYRASAEGGAFNAVAVNIEELYDQFSNGIRKHPMAIRNFVNFAIDKWGLDPKFILLLGKSIQYQYLIENSTNPSIINFEQCLVPTFGHQPSDNLLVCPKLMHDYRPLCAVGRVPARTPNDVKNYLDKLKQYESLYITNCNDLSNRYWMNRLVHIASGANSFEMNTYLSHFVNYEQYATSPPASMNLAQTFSSSTAAIEPEPQFKQLFESGLNVIEYSGHSTINDEGYWDFDIARDPDQYNNQGKYPIVFSQSCFAGQIHDTQSKSISEEYVMDEQGGFICMLATLALSSPALMNEFTDPLFQNFYIDHYGESVGENIVHTIKEIFIPMGSPNWEDVAVTSTEFTFCGDPAVRPYLWKNPEYLISGVTSYPNLQSNTTVDVACSGIQLNVNIDNLGKVQGTVQVKVIRVMPDGSQIEEINQVINSPDRSQTLTFNLPSRTDQGGLGVNDFIISINQNGAVTEDCYNNNQFFIDNVNLVSSGTGSQSLQIVGLQNSYCSDAGAVTLQGNPWGGSFTIDGVQSYVLYPSQLSAGTHTIAYNYVDGGGCAYSVQQTVSIAAPPVATFDYIQNVCTGQAAIFDYTGNEPDWNLSWNFGEGASQNIVEDQGYISIVYNTPGTKNVILTVQNASGCTAYKTVTVNVLPKLQTPQVYCTNSTDSSVEMAWSSVSGANGYVITYNGSSQVVYGNSFLISNLSFGQSVTFQVYAVGQGGFECSNSDVAATVCTITACPSEQATFTAVPTQFCKGGAAVALSGQPAGGYFQIDGNTVTVLDPATLNAGNHVLQYFYADPTTLCSYVSAPQTFTITQPVPIALTASDLQICPGEEVTITAADENNIVWTGPNIISQNGSALVAAPEANATYTATTTDFNGCTKEAQITIIINESALPTADFSLSDYAICSGEIVEFINDSQNDESSTWEVIYPSGQVSTFSDNAPSVAFEEAGVYDVKLTVQGCGNTSDEVVLENIISVTALPDFEIDAPQSVCPNESFVLQLEGTQGNAIWQGNGLSTTIGLEVNAALSAPETYIVTVNGENNCSKTDSVAVDVYTVTPLTLSNDTTLCSGDTIQVFAAGAVSFAWSPATAVSDATSPNPSVFAADSSFTLTVAAADENGCAKTGSVSFTINDDLCICDDGDCNTTDIYNPQTGACEHSPIVPPSCDDNDPTTVDAYNPENCGCEHTIIPDTPLFIPNAITPNGDNSNDVWFIEGLAAYPEVSVTIYNRWGQLLYEAAPYGNNWTGEYENEPLPDGTYYYILKLTRGGESQTGTITIIR